MNVNKNQIFYIFFTIIFIFVLSFSHSIRLFLEEKNWIQHILAQEIDDDQEVDHDELKFNRGLNSNLEKNYLAPPKQEEEEPKSKNIEKNKIDIYNDHDTVIEFKKPNNIKFNDETQIQNKTEVLPIDKEFNTSNLANTTEGFYRRFGNIELRIFGNANLKTSYGVATYFTRQDALNDITLPTTKNINNGFALEPEILLNVKGKIGKRLLIDIDYSQTEHLSENQFKIKYFAVHKREFVREVTLGNIEIDFSKSEFAVLQQKSKKGLGVGSKFKRGKFELQAVASILQGVHETEYFTGKSRNTDRRIEEYNYQKRQYYQLEAFVLYDGLTSQPSINSTSYQRQGIGRLVTLTSVPNTSSATPTGQDILNYNVRSGLVNIDIASIEVWLDDTNPSNDSLLNAQSKVVNTQNLGNFHLVQPSAYTVDNNGLITFLNPLSVDSKVYVRYTRNNGTTSTTDPAARVLDGKLETFIKFGRSINEDIDRNGTLGSMIIDDNVINYDIYEVRGIYNLDALDITPNQFFLNLIDKNLAVIDPFVERIGRYNINYRNGIIYFYLREPFKAFLDISDTNIDNIYNEELVPNINDSSNYFIRANFIEEVQSYRLRNFNILKNSVVVKVDGKEIPKNLYFVDYITGFLNFIDQNNPVITSSTQIEISYEYSPFGESAQGFIVGARADYKPTDYFNIGGSVLYRGQFQANEAPLIGQESTSKLILEADLNLKLNEERFTKLLNSLPGVNLDLVPLKLNLYGEYAHSFYIPNTVNRALVDNFELSEETLSVSISDRDWVLSSPPRGFTQCSRGQLLYRYFRDLGNIELGPTSFSSGSQFNPNYSDVAGPYNVAEGHLDPSQLENSERQISLVLDFDFLSGATSPYASVVTRRLSTNTTGVNLSNLSFIEISTKLLDTNNLTGGVKLRLELGRVNEDSDGDNELDTEDTGLDLINNDVNGDGINDSGGTFESTERNNILDFNEDRGYTFNPTGSGCLSTVVGSGPRLPNLPRTTGNGVLNTEDLNLDGQLSTIEDVVSLSETDTYITFDSNASLLNTNTIPGDNDWKLIRFYINHSMLSANQRQIFNKVENLRLYIVPDSGTTGSGKLLINSIRLGQSKWNNVYLKETGNQERLITDPSKFRGAILDNQSSRLEYFEDSFIRQRENEYEDLHGKRTDTERNRLREAALKIDYNFDSNDEYAYIQRSFLSPINLRFYRKINVWVNFLSSNSDQFLFRVGSSELDYLQFTADIAANQGWQRITFDIPEQDNINNCLTGEGREGCPNLRNIQFLAVGVLNSPQDSSSNTIWINDIFVSDPRIQQGDAYKIETLIEITKPFAKTKAGVPILDKVKIKYSGFYRSNNFYYINQPIENIGNNTHSLDFATDFTPWWNLGYNFTYAQTNSETGDYIEERIFEGNNTTYTHLVKNHYHFKNQYAPNVFLTYNYKEFTNKTTEYNRNNNTLNKSENTIKEILHTPAIQYKQQIPPFLKQKIEYSIKTDTNFYQKTTDTTSDTSSSTLEKEQLDHLTTYLQYELLKSFVKVNYHYSHNILVEKNFTDINNQQTIQGTYFFPFIPTKDFRYTERNTEYEANFGLNNVASFQPVLQMKYKYHESSFQDNEDLSIVENDIFQRYKRPNSQATNSFSLPFRPSRLSKKLHFVELISFNFYREVNVLETFVPFTRQSDLLEDTHGFKSRFVKVADRAFNLFKYPIWHHFISKDRNKNNFASGREYAQFENFQPASPYAVLDPAFARYNQNINLKENLQLGIDWKPTKGMTLRTEGGLSQDISRNGNLGTLPIHVANINAALNQSYDLMRLGNLGFWKVTPQDKYIQKSSELQLNFAFQNVRTITRNSYTNRYMPNALFSLRWSTRQYEAHTFSVRLNFDYRINGYETFIAQGDHINDDPIAHQIANSENVFNNVEYGTILSLIYSFEINKFRLALQRGLKTVIKKNPKYSILFTMELNRFEYEVFDNNGRNQSVDNFLIEQILDLNLHRNINGALNMKFVFELRRDIQTKQIRQRLFGFEIGFVFRVLF